MGKRAVRGPSRGVGLPASIRVIPIVDDEKLQTFGLVYGHRDPVTPLTAALIDIATSGRRDD